MRLWGGGEHARSVFLRGSFMIRDPSRQNARRRVRLLAPLLLAVIAALAIWMVATVWATYEPSTTIELSTLNSDEHPDITSLLDIDAPHVNFDAVLTFTPSEC